MAGIERTLARKPTTSPPTFGLTEPDDPERILTIIDPYEGKELWVFYRVDVEARECELGWIAAVPLEDPDGG